MPIYTYECKECLCNAQEWSTINERNNPRPCPLCEGEMHLIITPVAFYGDFMGFKPHYDYQLDEYFESYEHKRNRLNELGYTQVSGKFSPSSNDKNKTRVECTKEEANSISSGEINPHSIDKRIMV